MFGLFRANKEVPRDVEVIHVGDDTDEGNQQLDVPGYSNDGKKAYGIYSKDRGCISGFLARQARERAFHSVEKYGTKADLEKYMPSKKKSYVPNWQPLDIKITYLLRTRKMKKTRHPEQIDKEVRR